LLALSAGQPKTWILGSVLLVQKDAYLVWGRGKHFSLTLRRKLSPIADKYFFKIAPQGKKNPLGRAPAQSYKHRINELCKTSRK